MKTSLLTWLSVCMLSQAAFGDDWPHWRGPHNNGLSTEIGLPDSWSPKVKTFCGGRKNLHHARHRS